MIIVKEMSTGKRLDEACNHNNDAYDDEVLYTKWVKLPRLHSATPGSAANASPMNGYEALARLFYSVSDERH